MPVPQRLNRSLQRALGAEAAEDLVNLLDGVELQRSELRAFRESMRADFAEFRGELERQNAALRQDMTVSLAGLGERISGVEARLMRWSLVFWTGAVLAIAGLVIALR
jgi:hypothetical protein